MQVSELSTRDRWLIIALCAAIFALGQFHRSSGAVFTPILMDRFDLSATVISGLVSAMFLAAVLTQLPQGVVLDKYGPRFMLCVSIIVVSAGSALFAVANDYWTLLTSRIIIGIGAAVLGASSQVIVARSFPQREFGYVNGMIITLGSTGGLMGTYPLAFALSRFDWVWVFGTVSLAACVLAIIVLRTVKPGPVEKRAPLAGQPSGYRDLIKLAEARKILTLSIVTFAPITTITGIWGGPFLQDALDMTAESAGGVLLLLAVGSICAAFVFGQLDRRISSRKRMILTACLGSATCLLLLALLPAPGTIVTVGLLLAMICCQQFYIPLGAHMRKIVPIELVGRAVILLTMVGVAMIPIMQTAFGAILDWSAALGFDAAQQYRFSFGAMAALNVVCAVVYSTARSADPDDKRAIT